MCFLEDEICVLQRVAKTEERRPLFLRIAEKKFQVR